MKWVLFAIQILPYVLDAVRAAETAVTGSGQGPAKLGLVLGAVEAVYGSLAGDMKDLPQASITKLVTGIIEKVVGVFNAVGVFRGAGVVG